MSKTFLSKFRMLLAVKENQTNKAWLPLEGVRLNATGLSSERHVNTTMYKMF